MVIAPSNTQTSESVTTELELTKLPEQTPESQKAGVVAKTGQTLNRFTQVLGLTAVLATTPAMATESSYEPLADASGGTVLVLKEEGKGKEELFAAFDRVIKSEQTKERKKNEFNQLSPEYQKKALSYFQTGKNEQPNEKILLKGLNSLISLYQNIDIAKQGIAEFSAGKEPSQDPLAFEPMTKSVIEAFPSAKNFVDIVAIQKIDVMVESVYVQI